MRPAPAPRRQRALSHPRSKLPDWRGKLYRGLDEQGVELIKSNYTLGKSIHWSAMSSATPDWSAQ